MRRGICLVLLAMLAVACSDSASQANGSDAGLDVGPQDVGHDAQSNVTPDATSDTGLPDMLVTDTGWEEIQQLYGVLETVAGQGLLDNGNDWSATMEAGPALQAELSRPHIAVADGAGNVYIADKEAHAIRKVTPDGLIHTVAGTGVAGNGPDQGPATQVALSNPNGVWVRPDGVFWVLDLDNGKIRRVDLDGTMHTVVSGENLGEGRGLWVSADEQQMYWAAGNVVRGWTPQGAYTVATGFTSLGNLDVAPDGTLGVADRGASGAYMVDPASGQKTLVAGNGTATGGGDGQPATATGIEELRGFFFHPHGGFLVCGHKDHRVWYVDPAGIAHILVADPIDEPRAVTIAPSGDILITEHDNGIVRRLPVR